MPVPMMNILNGGVHADNPLDIQEFMIVPVRETSFRERLRICAEIYHMLRAVLKGKGLRQELGMKADLRLQIRKKRFGR